MSDRALNLCQTLKVCRFTHETIYNLLLLRYFIIMYGTCMDVSMKRLRVCGCEQEYFTQRQLMDGNVISKKGLKITMDL